MIFIDTWAWLALADKKDNNHKAAKIIYEKVGTQDHPLTLCKRRSHCFMRLPRSVSAKELIKALELVGYQVTRQTGMMSDTYTCRLMRDKYINPSCHLWSGDRSELTGKYKCAINFLVCYKNLHNFIKKSPLR